MILHTLRNSDKRKTIIKEDKWKLAKLLLKIVAIPFNARKLTEKMDVIMQEYNGFDTDYRAAISAVHYWKKEIVKKECFEDALLQEFESGVFPIPKGYDKYLSNLYGNYMVPYTKKVEHLNTWDVEI